MRDKKKKEEWKKREKKKKKSDRSGCLDLSFAGSEDREKRRGGGKKGKKRKGRRSIDLILSLVHALAVARIDGRKTGRARKNKKREGEKKKKKKWETYHFISMWNVSSWNHHS